MVLMLLLTTLPVILVTWRSTVSMRRSVERELISANESRMLWADQYLSELIRQIDTLFYTLQINEKLMQGLSDIESSDPELQFRAAEYIRDTLTLAFYGNSHKVSELILYFHSSRRAINVSYTSSGLTSYPDIMEGNWSRILKGPVNLYFKQENDTVSAYHSINRFMDRELIGGLSAKIDRKVWEEVGRILHSERDSSIYIFNDEDELLSGSTRSAEPGPILTLLKSADPEQTGLQFLKTRDTLYFMKQIADGELRLVKLIPLAALDLAIGRVINTGIMVGIFFVLLAVLLSILVSFRISRPIIELAGRMQETDLSSFMLTPVQGRDEIGLLEQGYNSMMKRIRELIQEEYQREIELRDARILALQSRINPHFLHNTLQLIGGMALTKGAPEIYNVTRIIGELLRYSISTGGDLVSLGEELKHMQNYLYIQEQRFDDRCTIKTEIDETVLDCILPRFTLQPLVENAFEHGLQGREGAWELKIRVKRLGRDIGLMVYDNGCGFTGERIREIRRRLGEEFSPGRKKGAPGDPEEARGIGLSNVNSRIKLQFGSRYGLRVFSRESVGTLMVVMLPCRKKEEQTDV